MWPGLTSRLSIICADIIDFLANVECVEGRLDTYGTQGRDFTNDLVRSSTLVFQLVLHQAQQLHTGCADQAASNLQRHSAQWHLRRLRGRQQWGLKRADQTLMHSGCLQLLGGPTSKGFRKANLTPRTRTMLEEVALSEQVRMQAICLCCLSLVQKLQADTSSACLLLPSRGE